MAFFDHARAGRLQSLLAEDAASAGRLTYQILGEAWLAAIQLGLMLAVLAGRYGRAVQRHHHVDWHQRQRRDPCSAFTRVSACMFAKSPKATPYTGGSDGFVSSTTAPVATGWSDQLPGGIRTHWKSPPLHGALSC
jgi:hypothetical protein